MALLTTTFLLLALGAVAALSYRINGRNRRMMYVDYLAVHEQWPELIERAGDLTTEEFNVVFGYDVNLALHMTNRLGDDMFAFPQPGLPILELKDDVKLPYMVKLADMCLRLGRLDDAEHTAYEATMVAASDPRILRLLARIHMVKDLVAAAQKPLTVLSYDLVHGAWARHQLRQLEQDPQLAGDEEIQLFRRRMLRKDDMAEVTQGNRVAANKERLLLNQLQQDPTNRMAFEFLMSFYLISRDMDRISQLMPRIKDMTGPAYVGPDGKRRTPRHYQEAMAIWADKTGKPVNIEGFEIEPQTIQRMTEFKRLAGRAQNAEAAFQATWKDFGDSYFFFIYFGPGDYR